MHEKISVIIPTYNRAHCLARALDSVLSQRLPADEIIVVNDGSTDDTDSVLKNYPQVMVISQHNQGVSAARNRGIEAASGDWVALLDSDDEWAPDKLSQQWEEINKTQAHVCHNDEIWIRHGRRVNPRLKHQKKGGWLFRDCLALCLISPSAVMIHRRVFDSIGLFDESLPACEDYELWLRLTAHYEVAYVDAPLTIKYGGHDDQLSKRYWGMDRFRIKALAKCLAQTTLSRENRAHAIDTLKKKINIYCQGAKKRGKQDEITYYQSLLRSVQ